MPRWMGFVWLVLMGAVFVGCTEGSKHQAELGEDGTELSDGEVDVAALDAHDMEDVADVPAENDLGVEVEVTDAGADGADHIDEESASDLEEDTVAPCERVPLAEDAPRLVVVAQPYRADASKGQSYRTFWLSPEGDLSAEVQRFEMGRAMWGSIVFTSDGRLGFVAQEDGSVGVFRVGDDGVVTVVDAGYAGTYTGEVALSADEEHLFLLNPNWVENGGAIYQVRIGCDGVLSDLHKVSDAKLARAMTVVPNATEGGRYAVAAAGLSPAGAEGASGHLVHIDAQGSLTYLGGVDAFGDDEASVSAAAVTPDGRYFLVADNSGFASVPNRVAVVALDGPEPTVAQTLTPFDDPAAVVVSPYNNAAMVLALQEDALWSFAYDPAAALPFEARGQVAYQGPRPQLPGGAALLSRGPLRGLTLVTENAAVRRVRFTADGDIEDWGPTSMGEGYEAICGAIGVQP